MILLVTYDLHKPDRDYANVERLLKSAAGGWCHLEESVWVIDTNSSPQEWTKRLQAISTEATYFTVQLQKNWWSAGLSSDKLRWLKATGRSW